MSHVHQVGKTPIVYVKKGEKVELAFEDGHVAYSQLEFNGYPAPMGIDSSKIRFHLSIVVKPKP